MVSESQPRSFGERNRELAANYIAEQFEPEDRIAVMLIHQTTGRVVQRIGEAGSMVSRLAWLQHMNSQNYNVYLGVNPLKDDAEGRTKEDIAEVRRVVIDIDENGKEALDKIMAHPGMEKPNYVLESSPGKFQAVWEVNGFSKSQAELLQRNMVREFGGDPARVDVSSVLRIPGFRNCKYEQPHYVTVDRLSEEVKPIESFPRELFSTDRAYTPTEGNRRARGPAKSGIDQSKEDARWCCERLRSGDSPEQVRSALATRRADSHHNLRDYTERTVAWAIRAVERDQQRAVPR